ncbi:MAG: MFS transporter [Chloroflexi bacterium]|nr:MFS transporter [Chloroflexota bacterium]
MALDRAGTVAGAPERAGTQQRTIVFFSVAVFLYWIALYLYIPTLTAYAESKTDDLVLVGTALSMYGFWQAIVRLPLGIASDWLGRRKVFIAIGFGLAALGAYVVGAAGSIQGVILGRAIVGVAAATWVPLVVAFSSLFPPEEAVRASALLTFIGSIGRVLATGATGYLNRLGQRIWPGDAFSGYPLAYYLAAVAALLAILAVLPAAEERRPRKQPSLGSLGRLISRRDVLLPSLLSAVTQYGVWMSTFGYIPLIAAELGASGITSSLMVSVNIGVQTLANLAASGLTRKIGSRALVYIGFVLMSLGLAGVALAPSMAVLWVAQLTLGLSQGLAYPVLMGLSIRNVDEEQRASAMGLHQAVYAIGMFAGPWLGGILGKALGLRPMFGITAVALLLLGLAGTRLMDGHRTERAAL